MFAAYIASRIAELTNRDKTYRDFMHDLKSVVENKSEQLTLKDFISTASKYIPEDEITNAVE